MVDLSHSVEMERFQSALERVLFMARLLRETDYVGEDALLFLLADLDALIKAYEPVKKVINDMI